MSEPEKTILQALEEDRAERDALRMEAMGERPDLDPFADDTPLECGVENPESCESCQ